MAYSDLVVEGKNVNKMYEEMKEVEKKQEMKDQMKKSDETPNIVEYSMTLAGNDLEPLKK